MKDVEMAVLNILSAMKRATIEVGAIGPDYGKDILEPCINPTGWQIVEDHPFLKFCEAYNISVHYYPINPREIVIERDRALPLIDQIQYCRDHGPEFIKEYTTLCKRYGLAIAYSELEGLMIVKPDLLEEFIPVILDHIPKH